MSNLPEPRYVVGELVHVIHEGVPEEAIYRVQKVIYRSWWDVASGKYRSGYGYQLPLHGPTGHYWFETSLSKAPAHLIVKWTDCIWQPKEVK